MFNIPNNVQKALEILTENGFEAYIVGGCVRDTLLGKKPQDWDICTNSMPLDTIRIFKNTYRVIETGLKHGTVTVIIDEMKIEITAYRVDGKYSDCRHPEKVTFTPNLSDDLIRRDFTINAMVYSPYKGVIDFFGGKEDLKNKIIKCVGNPDERFSEDALRILRAIRFSSVLQFKIEKETKKSIFKNMELLSKISPERKAIELNKLILGNGVKEILSEFQKIITFIIPELLPSVGFLQCNPHHIYDVYEHTLQALAVSEKNLQIRLALLFHDIAKPLCFTLDENGIGHFKSHPEKGAEIAKTVLKNLKYDNFTISRVCTLIKYHDEEFEITFISAKKALNLFGFDTLKQLLSMQRADRFAHNKFEVPGRLKEIFDFEEFVDRAIFENSCYNLKKLAINGKDLINLGIENGTKIGEILENVLQKVISEELLNEKKMLVSYIKKEFEL